MEALRDIYEFRDSHRSRCERISDNNWLKRISVKFPQKDSFIQMLDIYVGYLKVMYPFLNRAQIRGRALQKMGIPSVMGEMPKQSTITRYAFNRCTGTWYLKPSLKKLNLSCNHSSIPEIYQASSCDEKFREFHKKISNKSKNKSQSMKQQIQKPPLQCKFVPAIKPTLINTPKICKENKLNQNNFIKRKQAGFESSQCQYISTDTSEISLFDEHIIESNTTISDTPIVQNKQRENKCKNRKPFSDLANKSTGKIPKALDPLTKASIDTRKKPQKINKLKPYAREKFQSNSIKRKGMRKSSTLLQNGWSENTKTNSIINPCTKENLHVNSVKVTTVHHKNNLIIPQKERFRRSTSTKDLLKINLSDFEMGSSNAQPHDTLDLSPTPKEITATDSNNTPKLDKIRNGQNNIFTGKFANSMQQTLLSETAYQYKTNISKSCTNLNKSTSSKKVSTTVINKERQSVETVIADSDSDESVIVRKTAKKVSFQKLNTHITTVCELSKPKHNGKCILDDEALQDTEISLTWQNLEQLKITNCSKLPIIVEENNATAEMSLNKMTEGKNSQEGSITHSQTDIVENNLPECSPITYLHLDCMSSDTEDTILSGTSDSYKRVGGQPTVGGFLLDLFDPLPSTQRAFRSVIPGTLFEENCSTVLDF